MPTKKILRKNLLSIIKIISINLLKQKRLLPFLLFCYLNNQSQIVNYVNNGGFEVCRNCTGSQTFAYPKYWNAIDSNKFFGILCSATIAPYLVPLSSYTYQWPRHGNNFLITTQFFPTCSNQTCVGYPRTKLKQTLQAGNVYCFTMYVNLSNQSTHAIDAIGVYFSDNTNDTIKYCTFPITYLLPQIENPVGNIISDTLNWTKISGTYTASGTENSLIIGDFKTSSATNSLLVNSANLPSNFSAYSIDDVSLINTALGAYAGPDIWAIPGATTYIGRPQDVGIDEACMWYKLPNTTNAIDTAAGITITAAATTETYMVKQDICGVIKYDTVVVHASALGFNELNGTQWNVKLFPNPASKQLIIVNSLRSESLKVTIKNVTGKIVLRQTLTSTDFTANLDLNLEDGVYLITLSNNKNESLTKKLVISN